MIFAFSVFTHLENVVALLHGDGVALGRLDLLELEVAVDAGDLPALLARHLLGEHLGHLVTLLGHHRAAARRGGQLLSVQKY